MSISARRLGALCAAVLGAGGVAAVVAIGAAPANTRLSNDVNGGYVSADTLAGLPAYTDATLAECSRSRGRQNEPSVAVDPRDPAVIVGSSNDYCGVYNDGADANGAPIPAGPIWLGYYRSEDRGTSFRSSLVPGYPGDTSVSGALARIRTASSGDPVMAWDGDGRLFMGSESSDDPAGSRKSFGDVWVARYVNAGGGTKGDGKRFAGSVVVDAGSSAPNLLGVFNDKTAIEADRTTNAATRGNVYFAWSRFSGNGGVAIYLSRSTDHGATFSTPQKLSASIQDVQFPEIVVTGNGHVYVLFRRFADRTARDAVVWVKSTDGGRTFSPPRVLTTFTPYDAQDQASPAAAPAQSSPDDAVSGEPDAAGASARDCGDFAAACASGYTFFRRDTQVRATTDQADAGHEWVHVVYDPTVPGSEVATGTTYGSVSPGVGSQSAIYYARLDGATGTATAPSRISRQAVGHQLMPDISASQGVLHAIWWDSRNDPTYSPQRPIGNDAAGNVVPSLDVFAATAPASGGAWTPAVKLTGVRSNPNFEQFGGRTVPFAGDYLWVSSEAGTTYATWTDWRDTVPGTDARETVPDETGADVRQCRLLIGGVLTGDLCPREGGLDQNIYGALAP